MIKFISILIFFLSMVFSVKAQLEVDSVSIYKELDVFVVSKNFHQNYSRELERVKKLYPMALKAKAIIDEYEAELNKKETKKEVRKYSKKMNNFLKDEFSYTIRDLYTSEGRLLMQLVHRETGKTVDSIIAEYAGVGQAFIYRNLAKLFDQDLKIEYNRFESNFYTELVINDILLGKVEFNPNFDKITKEAFKESQKKYRAEKKATRKRKKVKKK